MTRPVRIEEGTQGETPLADWQRVLIEDCERTMRLLPANPPMSREIEERFTELREYFLLCLKVCGQPRADLYFRAKPGDAREPAEEELVRRWAGFVNVPLAQIEIGIQRAFMAAAGKGEKIASFRDCLPHIQARADESRNGVPR
jgi:hypothetical protein